MEGRDEAGKLCENLYKTSGNGRRQEEMRRDEKKQTQIRYVRIRRSGTRGDIRKSKKIREE
jgi:hypothetical protein